MKKLLKIVLFILALLVLWLFLSTLIWPPINDVKTGATPEYPNIQPVQFKTDVITTFWTAARTAKTMPLWVLKSVQQKDLIIRAEARTPTLGFVDLVEFMDFAGFMDVVRFVDFVEFVEFVQLTHFQ